MATAEEKAKLKKKKQQQEKARQKAISSYLESNFGLTDSILKLDTTDPSRGFTLQEALDQMRKEKLANNQVGMNRAAEILAKTNWFMQYGTEVTKRMSQEKKASGVFNKQVDIYVAELRNRATQSGFDVSEEDLRAIARDSYIYGRAFDSAQVLDSLAEHGTVTATNSTLNALKEQATNMGVQYSDDWYATAAKSVAAGDANADDYTNQIKELAKSRYASFADQIDKGMTVQQIASPYINSMANLLELPATAISLNDTTINKALTNLDDKGNPVAKPIWKFEQELKQDDRYFQTNRSYQEMESIASSIARKFGKA